MTTTTLGKDLKTGDTIEVWRKPGRDTITRLRPYHGSLSYLWERYGGARLADFALNKCGMTIEPQLQFNVVKPESENHVGKAEFNDS